MSRVTWVKVGYYFAPQDRRKIGEFPIHEYVLKYFRDVFKQNVFGIEEDGGKTLNFSILDASEDQVEELVQALEPKLDLTEQSFYTITEAEDVPDDDELPTMADEDREDADEAVKRLVGVEDFKALCRDIVAISGTEDAANQQEFFKRCAVLFCISGGDGYTTYMDTLRRVLYAYDVRKFDGMYIRLREIKKAETLEEMFAIACGDCNDGEMISFDLTFHMQKADTEEFRDFVRRLHAKRGERFFVFKLPCSEGEERKRVEDELRAVFPLIVIDVPPFTTEQYTDFAVLAMKRMNYLVEGEAQEALQEMIVHKRNQKHFYGFRSVETLASEIVMQKIRTEIRRDEEMSLVVKKEDLLPLLEKYGEDQGGLGALEEMIGIESVQERIEEVLVQLEIASKLPLEERPCMHMIFSGNPGTGKTTVARILGKILKERNVLSKGMFFERSGREFVGKYIGETAPITNAICRDAYGSILFIDEAYTLYRRDDERDFGKEALDTLLTQMENHRQDLIVIFSGYSDRMKEMLDANPGLKSRIPHEIKFPNFSKEDLFKIYMQMAGKTYRHAEDLEQTAKEFFLSLSKEVLEDQSFSNARFVRNLYERTVAKAALRVQALSGGRALDATGIELTGEDFRKASAAEEFQSLLQKKSRMGFV